MFFSRLGVENDDSFCQDGAPDTGGTLKIYGEALRKEVYFRSATTLLHHRCKTLYMPISFCEIAGALQNPSLVCARYSRRSCSRDGGEIWASQIRGSPFLPCPGDHDDYGHDCKQFDDADNDEDVDDDEQTFSFLSPQSNLSMPEDGAPGVVVGGGTTRFVLYTSINSILQMLCCLLHIVGDGITIFAVLTFGEILPTFAAPGNTSWTTTIAR